MSFASCYSRSEKYVALTKGILDARLFPGWFSNPERR